MSNITLTVEEINKMNPLDIATSPQVKQRFIQIYDTIWGEGGEAAHERESLFFNRILSNDEKLLKGATRFSVFTAFIDIAVCGLSVELGVRALAYLQGRNYKIGKDTNGKDLYEGRLGLTISGYGELALRARCGQIKHADNPIIVYQEDSFSFSDIDGRKSVRYTLNYPHKSNRIIACFMRITRTDDSVDYAVMLEEDWNRLAEYSAKQNKKWDDHSKRYVKGDPNELYGSNGGSIDTGFLMAKCIKHAFKTYPKVRIGKGTELVTEQKDEDIYGVDLPEMAPAPIVPFGPQQDISAGVTVDTAEYKDDGAF